MKPSSQDPSQAQDPPGSRSGQRRTRRVVDPSHPCKNCGDPTPGQFCPSCGQRKTDVRVSVRTLVMEVLEDQFILDRRLPRTLGTLLFRPGRLTVEHINGRIARYIHPFRLYLVSSLIFFVLLSFFSLRLVRTAMSEDGRGIVNVEVEGSEEISDALATVRAQLADPEASPAERAALRATEAALLQQEREARIDSLETVLAQIEGARAQLAATARDTTIPAPVLAALAGNQAALERRHGSAAALLDSLTGTPSEPGETRPASSRTVADMFDLEEEQPSLGIPWAAADSAVARQVRRLGAMEPGEALETLLATFFNYVPTLMFVLLPVFAAVLKLLYIRRGRFYAEHFVFLLHVHSFVFIVATAMLLLRGTVPARVEVLLGAVIVLYLYLAMWRVYGQSWVKTLAKYWILGWTYFVIILVSILVTFALSLLLF